MTMVFTETAFYVKHSVINFKALCRQRGASEGKRCDWSTKERERKHDLLLCARETDTVTCIEKWLPLQYHPCIAAIYSISYAPLYLYRDLTFILGDAQ